MPNDPMDGTLYPPPSPPPKVDQLTLRPRATHLHPIPAQNQPASPPRGCVSPPSWHLRAPSGWPRLAARRAAPTAGTLASASTLPRQTTGPASCKSVFSVPASTTSTCDVMSLLLCCCCSHTTSVDFYTFVVAQLLVKGDGAFVFVACGFLLDV